MQRKGKMISVDRREGRKKKKREQREKGKEGGREKVSDGANEERPEENTESGWVVVSKGRNRNS